MILDGKLLSQKLSSELKTKIKLLKTPPCLALILLGSDYASCVYVKNKIKACQELGIKSRDYLLPESTSQSELLRLIAELNEDSAVDGILVQLPLPAHINKDAVLSMINPLKDVDGFCPLNLGLLLANMRPHFYACTPLGIFILLEHYGIELSGKNVCVINDSIIVGRPLAAMLINAGASVAICHKQTNNLKDFSLQADIIISATGVLGLINDDFIKPGAVVIDVGITKKIDGKIIAGDYEKSGDLASMYSPVPGGVGPMTIYALMQNTYEAKKIKEENE